MGAELENEGGASGEIEDRSVNRLARKVAPSSRSRVRTTPSRRLEMGLYVQPKLFKRLYK